MPKTSVEPVNPTIDRDTILKSIGDCLDRVKQWAKVNPRDPVGWYENAAAYSAKAEALINLLEIDDCGSSGGFDEKRNQKESMTVEERYEFLKSLPQRPRSSPGLVRKPT